MYVIGPNADPLFIPCRKCKQCKNIARADNSGVLSCTELRAFWIRWYQGLEVRYAKFKKKRFVSGTMETKSRVGRSDFFPFYIIFIQPLYDTLKLKKKCKNGKIF